MPSELAKSSHSFPPVKSAATKPPGDRKDKAQHKAKDDYEPVEVS